MLFVNLAWSSAGGVPRAMDRKLQKSAPAAAKCPAVISLGVEAILAAPTFSETAEKEPEAARVK